MSLQEQTPTDTLPVEVGSPERPVRVIAAPDAPARKVPNSRRVSRTPRRAIQFTRPVGAPKRPLSFYAIRRPAASSSSASAPSVRRLKHETTFSQLMKRTESVRGMAPGRLQQVSAASLLPELRAWNILSRMRTDDLIASTPLTEAIVLAARSHAKEIIKTASADAVLAAFAVGTVKQAISNEYADIIDGIVCMYREASDGAASTGTGLDPELD